MCEGLVLNEVERLASKPSIEELIAEVREVKRQPEPPGHPDTPGPTATLIRDDPGRQAMLPRGTTHWTGWPVILATRS